MNQPDVTNPFGLRDRALLETLYSTAMRRSELIRLTVYDLDTERRIVTIRLGKGRKDRNVPIGERALKWIAKYQQDVRPAFAERTGTNVLFLSRNGRAFGPSNLSVLVRKYITSAGIILPGSCHLFRHAAATLMLEHGADIRSLQSFLGHAELTTTQIYTHVSIQHLLAVHRATHPADLPRPAASDSDPSEPGPEAHEST